MKAFILRYSPLFSVIAAALIFASWLVSNFFLERAKSAKERASAILSAQRDYWHYSQLKNEESNIEKIVTGIDNDQTRSDTKGMSNNVPRIVALTTSLQWVQIGSVDLSDLMDFVDELKNQCGQLTTTAELVNELDELASNVDAIQSNYWGLRDRYYAQQTNLLGEPGISTERITTNMLAQLEPLVWNHAGDVDRLLKTKEPLEDKLLQISSRISGVARDESSIAERQASTAQHWVLIFYVFGTLFAIWGKIIEIKQRKPGESGDDAPDI